MIDARREVAARTRDYELSGRAFVGKDRDLVSCDRDERAAGLSGSAGGGEGGLAPLSPRQERLKSTMHTRER
eukprot:3629432-Rhodomonas_salina.1